MEYDHYTPNEMEESQPEYMEDESLEDFESEQTE